jgi:hypothetical protein
VKAAADVDAAVLEAFGVDPVDRAAFTPAERAAAERLLTDRYRDPAWHAGPEPPPNQPGVSAVQ